MFPESNYLAAVGNFDINASAAQESWQAEKRMHAARFAGRAAANVGAKVIYGSIMALIYTVAYNNWYDPDSPKLVIDKDFAAAYGDFVGAAVGQLRTEGEPLPQSFAPKVEAIIAKNSK